MAIKEVIAEEKKLPREIADVDIWFKIMGMQKKI